MAKKARQRISYVLELAGSQSGGHRLGVNGLAVDPDNAILYSGGRDGVVCAWDLNLNLLDPQPAPAAPGTTKPKSVFRGQTQAHTHWINDIALAQNNQAVVSASSDLTVKLWRPHSDFQQEPATIGQHADYVKCVAAPSQQSSWLASGGLDRKICLWDLNGGGKTLEIDVSGEEVTEKGSVYALSANHSILASGGPESILRLWDPRTGKNITKFVGHTDNVRAILVDDAGHMVMTASSDQTVKVWSVTAGRCMHTLTMHNDSVWSLFSDAPDLSVFYSSDRSGMVVKTDVRGTMGEMDDGLCIAVAQENEGVSKVVACRDHIWTTTSSSSINRWADVDTGENVQLPEELRQHRASIGATVSPPTQAPEGSAPPVNGNVKKEIPIKSILRISNTASFPPQPVRDPEVAAPGTTGRKGSEPLLEPQAPAAEAIHLLPEETIEGQFGLVKHRLLNDRRRVLTLDTAGDVLLWDLIKCKPIQKFGKKHLEDVEPEVNTLEAVAPWCSIDTSSGNLTVVLEPYNCFDAEMYADELILEEPVEFREDQRINLGKWILRYLFSKLIDEEIKRDEAHRHKLNEAVERRLAAARAAPPPAISLPTSNLTELVEGMESPSTPRANGALFAPTTPGLAIALATPAPVVPPIPAEYGGSANSADAKATPHASQALNEKEDYFSNDIGSVDGGTTPGPAGRVSSTPAEAAGQDDKSGKQSSENGKEKEKEKDKDKENGAKSPSTPFGKKFRMGMSFGGKKLGRSLSSNADKPAVTDDKPEDKSESSSNHDKEFDDSFLGVVQKIQDEYEKQLVENPDSLVETKVTPSLANDTPVLKLPLGTKVIIQEETQGGSAELYKGTVETVGIDADIIEKRAPMWLGEVLLQNAVPLKDPIKVSFILHPWRDSLPTIATADGNNRLNANRMLRVRKILAYVAERIDPATEASKAAPDALKPEEYLELYCNEQLLPNTMSLATLRAHVWKGGNDILLYYKANGKKEIAWPPPPASEEPEAESAAASEQAAPPPAAQTATAAA